MLKTEYIDIFMTTTNKSNFYNKKGYKCKKGDVVKINVYDLGKYDKTFKLTIACDECGKEKEMTNANYWKNYGDNNEPYYCKECIKNKLNKRKCEICGDTHGVSNYLNKGKFLCNRHKRQMLKYGYVKRTCKDRNEIRVFDDYIEFDTYSKEGQINGTFKADLDMIDFIKEHKCHKHYDGYATCHIKDKNGEDKKVRLHRVVLGLENDENPNIVVDHINRDKSDNRKINLRVTSYKANNRNVGMYSHNTSGVKGISWDKKRKKWEVYIHQNNKKINLGLYDDKERAIKVREIAEIIYFGTDSPRYEELIDKYIDEIEIKNYLLNKKK